MKVFFLSRQLREKVLLVLFLVVAALIWLSSISTRANSLFRQARDTSDDLSAQREVLNRQQAVNARARASIENFDSRKTLNPLRLQGELDTLARQNGINTFSYSDNQTTSAGQFAINTTQFIIRNVQYSKLVDFYATLSKQAPYIGIEQITITNPASNGQLVTSIKVSSVEILAGAH